MNNQDFHFRIIKARVAEAIIKELFQINGYTVFEYGMERTLPNILGKIKDQDADIAKSIRAMPDFVVQNTKNGKLDYVEVKYRKNGEFGLSDLIAHYPYKNAIFIIVSKEKIQVCTFNQLHEGHYLPEKAQDLIDSNLFDLNPNSVLKYIGYVQAFFKDIE